MLGEVPGTIRGIDADELLIYRFCGSCESDVGTVEEGGPGESHRRGAL